MSVNDPHAAPPVSEDTGFNLTGPRAVSAGNGWQWIAEGFGYFKRNPWAWIGAFIVWFVMLFVLALIPILGAVASMLLTYVFIGGYMIGCREQADGGDFTVGHLFAGFSSHFGNLVLLSLVYCIAAVAIMGITLGSTYFSILAGGGEQAIAQDPTGFLLSLLIGLALMIPVLMAFWFAPALIVINNVPVFQAMRLSFLGCLRNIVPFLLYGIIGLLLYIVALIPFGLGLLVFVPVMLASIFTAYRDIFTA